VQDLVISADVAPTILALCGLPAPESMQGRSLGPLLRGDRTTWRQDFFCESLIQLQDYPVIQGVRSADWKYIRYWPNRAVPADYRELLNLGLGGETPAYDELFHLATDPLEQQNLAANPQHQAQLAAMRVRCTTSLKEARGEARTLPTMSMAHWTNEATAAWKDLLPLLQKVPEGRKGPVAPATKKSSREK
jgi:arylsulfatase A-like enzyme